jgi:adenylate kinase
LATRRICSKCGSNAAPEWGSACGKCGGALVTRVDDGIEIVRERLKVYQRQTKPLVEYYAGRPSFCSIDGNRPPDVVTAAVDAALDAALESAGRGVAL